MNTYHDAELNEHLLPDAEGYTLSKVAKLIFLWMFYLAAFLAFMAAMFGKFAHGAEREPSTGLVRITQEYVAGPLRAKMLSIGSGICVTPDGWILTAAHVVDKGDKCVIQFDGATNTQIAAVVKSDRRSDIAVLKVEVGEELPCVPVADVSPGRGAEVYSEGYPAGQYARMEGRVRAVEAKQFGAVGVMYNQRSTVQMIETTHRLQQGNSGGPLYNEAGEVVGIASVVPEKESDVATFFCGTEEIQIALTQCGAKGWKRQTKRASKLLPKAYVIGSKDCGPCNAFKSDYGSKKRAGARPDLTAFLNQHWRVRYVEKHKASKLIAKHRIQGTMPVFMAANIPGGVLYGYEGADDLMAKLQQVLAQAPTNDQIEFEVGPDDGVERDFDGDPFFDSAEFMEGEGDPQQFAQVNPQPNAIRPRTPSQTPKAPPSMPPKRPAPRAVPVTPAPPDEELKGHAMTPQSETAEESEPEGDLSDVTAVVLVKKSVPGIAGKLVGLVEEHAKGKVTDTVSEALKGKAVIKVIFERTEPAKYAAILEAAGLTGESFGEVILVAPKKFDGIAGTIVEKVETALAGLKSKALQNIPVSAVFERTEEESYADVVKALGTDGGAAVADGGGFFSGGLLSKLGALLGFQSAGVTGFLLYLWRKVHRADAKAEAAVKVIKEA